MSEPLQTYLHDHFAGSTFAVKLLETLRKEYATDDLGRFAKEVLDEVQIDRDILKTLIQQIGSTGPDLKDAATWLAEKASRIKLRHDDPRGIGAFEALEALSLGILGKRSLWTALDAIRQVDSRVSGFDFADLARRADAQFQQVERFRLLTAPLTFQPAFHEQGVAS